MASPWIVVSDFDGTFTLKDVGNELCKEVIPELFDESHKLYRAGKLGLKEMQQRLWQKFPMNEAQFRERARAHGVFRAGVVSFVQKARNQQIPVFIASCGVRPYIEAVLDACLPADLRSHIQEIVCNEARFDAKGIAEFLAPPSAPDCPYPLDKGAWAQTVRARYPQAKIFAIGNGTSDRSFAGKVDVLAATEALADWCQRENYPHIAFSDFDELLKAPLFAS